jgi:hypothetical protein
MGFAHSLALLGMKIASQGCTTRPEVTFSTRMDIVESSNWITNREQLVRRAIDAEQTHLLFLDDDMTFDPRVLDIMMGRRQPVVCVNYLIKTQEPKFVAVDLEGKRVETRPESTGLVPISYSGFGVSLFDLEVFKAIPQPWFLPEFMAATSDYTTEDNPCYRKIREAGYKVYLDQDASKMVAHHGTAAWTWNQLYPAVDKGTESRPELSVVPKVA